MKIKMKQKDLLSEHTGIERYLFIISMGLAVALLVTSTASATGSETISIGSATVNNGEIIVASSNNAPVADSEIKDNTIVISSVQSDSTNDKSNGDEDAAARYTSTSSQANTQNKDTDEISSAIDQTKPATPGFGWFLTVLNLLFITNIYRKK